MDDGYSSCVTEPGFFSKEVSDRYFVAIKSEGGDKWSREVVRIFNEERKMHRITIHYGDEGTRFRYSGVKMDLQPWDKTVKEIRDILNEKFNLNLNFCVATIYKDGSDNIGIHSDKLKDMKETIVVSVSFGATRDFVIKPRKKCLNKKPRSKLYSEDSKGRSNFRIVIPLKHGDLAMMKGDMQSCWYHSVPKRSKVNPVKIKDYGETVERISLTFRVMKSSSK